MSSIFFKDQDGTEVQTAGSLPETEKRLRKPASITVSGEDIPLATNMRTGFQIERETKVAINDYLRNMDVISIEKARDIVAIAAGKDKNTSTFRERLLDLDDFSVLMDAAQNVILGIAFPGNMEAAEKKIDEWPADEWTKNELRVRLGLPEKDLTGKSS